MKPTKNQLAAALLALLLIASGAAAYTTIFTAGSGTAYEAPDGLTVSTTTDHGLNDRNPFVNNQTIYIDGVRFSSTATTSLTADAFNASGWTNVSSVDATNASITIAPDGRPNATISGSPTQFALADIAVDDGATDVVVDGSTDTTVTTSALPADTTVYAVDANGQIIDRATTDSSGQATFTVHHTVGTHSLNLGNGVLKQNYADSDRHITFTTASTTPAPASLVSDTGMNATVTSGTQIDVSNAFPFTNTVNLSTSDGDIEFVGNSPASATVAPEDIAGTYTNLTAVDATNAFTADPEDKAQLTIDGAATDVAWTDYAADDGTVDTVISGPDGTSTDVTYYGLPSDLTMTAINASTGTPLAVTQSDSSGQATFNIDHSEQTIKLVSGDETETPEQSKASPEGDQSTKPTEFNVTVTDQDFPDDSVDVTIDSDGSQIFSTTVTQNSTVTTSMPSSALTGGEHTWTVNTTDKFGNTRVVEFTYTIPDTVYIYNETRNANGIHELIDGQNVSVRATLTGSEGTVVEDTIADGSFDLTGYDPTQTYILTVETSDYYVRSVYLPNLYEQNSIFLLNKSQPSKQNIITVEDRTGNYDDNPVLETQRVINTSEVANMTDEGYKWVTIAGDRLGADNTYTANFEQDKRYRFVVTNADGDSRVLGEYVAKTDQPINLEIGSVTYEFGDIEQGYEWTATIENTSSGGLITYAYNDYNNLTDSITLEIRDRDDGTILVSETFSSGPYGELVYTKPITQDQYDNSTWEVSWSAERGDETVSAVRPIGGRGPVDFGALDGFWVTAGFSLVAFILAFAVGAGISAGAGGLAVAGWMGIAWYIGAVPTELGAGAIIIAFLVAAWTTVNEQQTEVIQ